MSALGLALWTRQPGALGQVRPPCGSQTSWVAFSSSSRLDGAFALAAKAGLETELARRGLALCDVDEKAALGNIHNQVARILVDSIADGSILLTLVVHESGRQVERVIRLSEVPSQGQALAFSLAADELLRTSLLPFSKASPPKDLVNLPTPRATNPALASSGNALQSEKVLPQALPSFFIGASGGAATAGQGAGGPRFDLVAEHTVGDRVFASVSGGFWSLGDVRATHGTISAMVTNAFATLGVATPMGTRLVGDLRVGPGCLFVRATGDPSAGERGGTATAYAIALRAAVGAKVRVWNSVFVTASAGSFWLPASIQIADGASTVIRLAGLGIDLQTGAGVLF